MGSPKGHLRVASGQAKMTVSGKVGASGGQIKGFHSPVPMVFWEHVKHWTAQDLNQPGSPCQPDSEWPLLWGTKGSEVLGSQMLSGHLRTSLGPCACLSLRSLTGGAVLTLTCPQTSWPQLFSHQYHTTHMLGLQRTIL